MDKKSKEYEKPDFEIILLSKDIITLSLGDAIQEGGDNEEEF